MNSHNNRISVQECHMSLQLLTEIESIYIYMPSLLILLSPPILDLL